MLQGQRAITGASTQTLQRQGADQRVRFMARASSAGSSALTMWSPARTLRSTLAQPGGQTGASVCGSLSVAPGSITLSDLMAPWEDGVEGTYAWAGNIDIDITGLLTLANGSYDDLGLCPAKSVT